MLPQGGEESGISLEMTVTEEFVTGAEMRRLAELRRRVSILEEEPHGAAVDSWFDFTRSKEAFGGSFANAEHGDPRIDPRIAFELVSSGVCWPSIYEAP